MPNKNTARDMRLPANFGKINPAAPFDVNRYFTALDSTGANPRVVRFANGNFCTLSDEVRRQRSAVKKRRINAALAWSKAQDPKQCRQHSYLSEILKQIPGGYFEYHLG
jgi:hypothetical protein